MTQPTAYERAYSFTDFSSGSPSSQPPGAKLDAEFDAIGLTTDQILANLAKIQRDDGRLATGSVQVDQLGSTALALILKSTFIVRGQWLTSTAYALGDMVTDGTAIYICMIAHTSGVLATDIVAAKFVKAFDATASTPSPTPTPAPGGLSVLRQEFTALAAQTTFGLSSTPVDGYVSVYKNGLRLASSAFVLAGANVVLGSGATVGDKITVEGFQPTVLSDASLVSYGTRTVADKLGEIVSVKDSRFGGGAKGDGVTNDTVAIAAAVAAVTSGKGACFLPSGTYIVSGTGVLIPAGVKLFGASRTGTVIKNLNGNVLRLTGEGADISDLTVWSVGGGHTIVQAGIIAQAQFRRFGGIQSANGYSIFDNGGFEHINNRLEHFELTHTTTATVPSWNLTGPAGSINGNTIRDGRISLTGTYGFAIDGTGSSDPQYDNIFEGIQFEGASGGGIRLKGCSNFIVTGCTVDDTPTIAKDFYSIELGTGGSACSGVIQFCARRGAGLGSGISDVKLPASGGGAGMTLMNCSSFGGSYGAFAIDAQNNACLVIGTGTAMTVANTSGLQRWDTNLGTLDIYGSYKVGGTKVVGARGAAVADATDAASAITQLNTLLARVRAHGLIA